MNDFFPRRVLTGAVFLIGSVLAGCGGDQSESGSAADDRIKLMFIGQITDTANATPLPEAAAGVRAAVARINAEGGLNGQLLALDICDDKADANEATKCARKAARGGVVATVGNSSNFGNVILPVLEQAGIVSIGHNPISPQDFSSPVAFPLQGGSPSMIAGAAKMLAARGVTRIRIAAVDSPAGAASEQFARAGLKGTGSELVGMTLVPIGAPDYAIYARAIFQDSDGVVLGMNADQAARMIVALRQADPLKPIAVTMAALPPATVAQLGSAAEGLLVVTPFRPITAGGDTLARYLGDMQVTAPDARINGFSLQGWLAVQTFYTAMKESVTPITAVSVLARMSSLDQLVVGEALAPLTTKQEKAPPFNRLFNSTVQFGAVSDSEIKLIDEQWHEITFD